MNPYPARLARIRGDAVSPDPIRFTLERGRIHVHSGMGERAPQPDEVELIREALEPPPVPLWVDLGVVAAVVGALAWLGHGIGNGVIGK